MKSHTYYDILGVSRDATLDEITTAKNALAKVYHPDANAHKNIDTTAFMQEILEAYRVLSNPEKRRKYNQETFGETERVFKTFTLTPENEEENTGSFVTYWNMSNQLRTILNKSIRLMKQETQTDPTRFSEMGQISKRRNDPQSADRKIIHTGRPIYYRS